MYLSLKKEINECEQFKIYNVIIMSKKINSFKNWFIRFKLNIWIIK